MDNIDEVFQAFEAGTISGGAFSHEQHILVAWRLARRYGYTEGLRRLEIGIKQLAENVGRPQVFHQTVTQAWYELLASIDPLVAAPELHDRKLLSRYYSPDRLAAGRTCWLEPDLHPLHLDSQERSPTV